MRRHCRAQGLEFCRLTDPSSRSEHAQMLSVDVALCPTVVAGRATITVIGPLASERESDVLWRLKGNHLKSRHNYRVAPDVVPRPQYPPCKTSSSSLHRSLDVTYAVNSPLLPFQKCGLLSPKVLKVPDEAQPRTDVMNKTHRLRQK